VSAHLDKDVFYLPTLFRPLQCWALDLMLDLSAAGQAFRGAFVGAATAAGGIV
jgi:hypothetical protein